MRHSLQTCGETGTITWRPKTATETRHAAATAVAEKSAVERTKVATAMLCSVRTQELYYQMKKGKRDAVEGYRVMEGMRREEGSGKEGSILG